MTRYLTIFLLTFFIGGCASTLSEPQDRKHSPEGFAYLTYNHKTSDASRVEVMVFFGYQCPHCFKFYTDELANWMATAPKDVNVVLVPVVWTPTVIPSTRAFHVAELLGKNPKFHGALFAAFQAHDIDLTTETAVGNFAASCCSIDKLQFKTIYESSAVDQMISHDESMLKEYNIGGTPSVIVNAKYYVSPETINGGKLIDVIDTLVKRERGNIAPR